MSLPRLSQLILVLALVGLVSGQVCLSVAQPSSVPPLISWLGPSDYFSVKQGDPISLGWVVVSLFPHKVELFRDGQLLWQRTLMTGEVVEQRYEPLGTYNFTLVVVDLSGAVGSSSVRVKVYSEVEPTTSTETDTTQGTDVDTTEYSQETPGFTFLVVGGLFGLALVSLNKRRRAK